MSDYFSYYERTKRYKNYAIAISFFLLFLCFLIGITQGAQTLNSSITLGKVTDTTLTFIVEYKNTVRASGATLDGVNIENFDTLHNVNYTATGLEPNTTHQFCIYKDLVNCETATTYKSSEKSILEYIAAFVILFACLVCLITAVYGVPFMSYIAFVLSLLGIIQSLNNSFIMGSIYAILAISAIYVSMSKGE